MRIINTANDNEVLATITTNHSMSLDEAIKLMADEILPDTFENDGEPRVRFGDKWYYYEDLDMEW